MRSIGVKYAVELLMAEYIDIDINRAIDLLEDEFGIIVEVDDIKKIFTDIINNRNMDSFDVESRRIEYEETIYNRFPRA